MVSGTPAYNVPLVSSRLLMIILVRELSAENYLHAKDASLVSARDGLLDPKLWDSDAGQHEHEPYQDKEDPCGQVDVRNYSTIGDSSGCNVQCFGHNS